MTTIKELNWTQELMCDDEDTLHRVHIPEVGRFTVLDRMTGFGFRDVETGFKDTECKFWLASGQKDIRDYPDFSIDEAIEWVKRYANTCISN